MESNWVKHFYKRQFELYPQTQILKESDFKLANQIAEQIGMPFQSVLELGAGNGLLARALSTFDKSVTTIELVSEMVKFAKQYNNENITSLCGSFYNIDLNQTFDALLYIDGFGIGTDKDQLALLKRIFNWLKDDGIGLIDIYQPEYWKKTNGMQMATDPSAKVLREYGYEEKNNRMTDTLWEMNNPDDRIVQSLSCYTPDEIVELCNLANLQVISIFPGGAMDFENWSYKETVTLSKCLSYRIKIKKV
ncbi:class I SAM-dependent methyltransferase [Viridibacillus arvi]|uniref:Methyltransferase n=1 Tax=Viridibacillus arvi TaxID=263475 RepID=A0A0M0LLV3_9BACL|nr:class I SAM-dependent methyltransferase [Viridibacillus arvi]KOO52019.1 methyltransferase [Viridibacillus arvi]